MVDENRFLAHLFEGPNVNDTSSSSTSNDESSSTSTETDNITSSSNEEEEDLLLFHLMHLLMSGQRIQRVKNYLEVIDSWSDEEFRKNLRIRRRTALKLIEDLESSGYIPIHHFGMIPISSKLSFLLFLWYLANTEPLRTLADRFDISISSVFRVLRRVIKWILTKLDDVIRWPDGRDADTVCDKFFLMNGIPHVLGAIDCTHIKILKPSINSRDYFDRKKNFTLNLQAVVDCDKRYINIHCGEPGSLHDARVFRRSTLYQTATNNQAMLFPNNTFLLGDSAYPVKPWIVPPFRNNGHLTGQQIQFNKIHSSTRVVVEQSFGALKGRFRRIKFFTEYRQLSFVTNSIVAACILHNYCINEDDEYDFSESESDSDDDGQEQVIEIDRQDPQNNRRDQLFREIFYPGH